MLHRTNCFEILGFDIMIDSDLKPWLIEVNITPSMACDSPLDNAIKSTVVTDTFNLIGLKRFDRKKESINKIKYRMKGLYSGGNPNSLSGQKLGSAATAQQKKSMLSNGIQGTSLSNQPMGGSGASNNAELN